MMEIVLVEGVSDVRLISYYLQKTYGWKHEKNNALGISENDEYEHIESLSKQENQLVLCGVGGNGKFAPFVEKHRINMMLVEKEIASLMVVTDRDEDSDAKVGRKIGKSLESISIRAGEWIRNDMVDSFGQHKIINTYLMIIPPSENGALERVIINALNDIPEEKGLIQEVIKFIESLKNELVKELEQINKYDKAVVGTFFSVRNPQNALRSFGAFLQKVDWSKSEYLKELFLPFMYLGGEKPIK